jgi:8-oxo-dGTP pyrophosphatase MutT (NUDIX family)|tara:strand:- start:6017 stop:6463 length:447 start_codon:yes stop_codon:yes gene_type:complete
MATSNIKDKNIVCSGALFYARSTKRFLFLERTKTKTAGQWGLVGGMAEGDETPWKALEREISEEVGKTPPIKKVIPLEMFTSNDSKFFFHTYLAIIEQEFIPQLNEEHSGYAWTNVNCWPKPLHVGLRNTLQNKAIKEKLQTVLDLIV